MSAKRKSQGRETDKPSDANSIPMDIPDKDIVLFYVFDLNLSYDVAEILVSSVDIAFKYFEGSVLLSNENNKKQLNDLEKKMDTLFYDIMAKKDDRINDAAHLAEAYYYLTLIYISSNTDEYLCLVRLFLARSIELLCGNELKPRFFMIAMRVYEISGAACIESKIFAEAIEMLQKPMRLYAIFTKENDVYAIPNDIIYLPREQQVMNVADRLRFVYMSLINHMITACRSKEFKESYRFQLIECEHIILKLCLQYSSDHTVKHVFIKSSLDLTNVFLWLKRFREARDHIAVACLVLQTNFRENRKRYVVDCNYCEYLVAYSSLIWAKYGLGLLKASTERLLVENNKDSFTKYSKSVLATDSENIQSSTLLFTGVGIDRKEYISLFAETFPCDYDNAKEVFTIILKCLFRTIRINLTKGYRLLHNDAVLYFIDAYQLFTVYEPVLDIRLYFHARQNHLSDYALQLKSNSPVESSYRLLWLKKVFFAIDTFDIIVENKSITSEITECDDYELKNYMITLSKFSLMWFDHYLHTFQ